jgi:hypothetical protein
MTRDDITRMARKAGCIPRRHPEYWDDVQVFATPDVLERFAALVAAAEREACAKLIESRKTGANELMDAVRDMEAKAIRARGQK